MEGFFELLLCFLLIFCFIVCFSSFLIEEKIEDYDISNASLVDNFITYTCMGYPSYYLIYKFEDNSVIEFKVSAEQYYTNVEGS